LEQGIAENAEIVAFIRARVAAERTIAASLINPPPTGTRGTGFDVDDGAALLRAFQGLKTESAAQGDSHKNLGEELEKMVADPFENWAAGHAERIRETQHVLLDVYIKTYEDKGFDIVKLKQTYLNKTRLANEAEDDAKFAPNQNLGDAYTSPRLKPTTPSRTGTVSDRIRKSLGTSPSRGSSVASDATNDTATAETEIKVDKGKGRATTPPPEVASPPPMSPAMPPKLEIPKQATPQPLSPILLAGLALSPAAVSALLLQASKELKTTTLKLPFIGEYKDCFTGADFVDLLRAKVPGFDDSVERAGEAARDLTERENLLRRVGELGNAFEDSQAALYQFRPKLGEYAADGVFGLDLGKWGAASWGEGESGVDTIPGVITALLSALTEKYKDLPSDEERRRTWIYEVPLSASHRLREAINDLPADQSIPAELFAEFDAPVVAATTKLWFLELNPPLCLWETWDEMRKVYPSVGAAQTEDRRVEDLQTVLMRLPKVNLLVLDTVIQHLKELVEATAGADEATDVYVAKLGLSLGRVFMRPKVENELSIQDRHPKLLVVDLIERYEEILPPTVAKKKKEVARAVPQRKRTKPFDQRVSRRSMQMQQQDPRKLLEAQQANQAGRPRAGSNAGQNSNPTSPGSVEPGPPPRPTFVDPGEPPRPTFVEPGAPPTFAEPHDGQAELSVPGEGIIVQPPTPIASHGESTDSPSNETPGSPPRATSPPLRARSPPGEGALSRTPSGTTRGAVRGPRIAARGPRAPPGAAA
ncbi:hypothetical protein FRC08_011783, partial [Ceratobasidium sp. 394]